MSAQGTREQLLNEGDKTPASKDPVEPYRIQLNLTAAHVNSDVIEGMLDGLIEDAEHRGFNLEWAYSDRMPLEDVIPGSPLDRVVKGVDDTED